MPGTTKPGFGTPSVHESSSDSVDGLHEHVHGSESVQNGSAKSTATQGKFPRISRPVQLMRQEYDVVVIGSGYGGGVSASRMARAGQSVCVLELGKERWPGEFPESLKQAFSEIHVSGQFHPDNKHSLSIDTGNKSGLYHLVLGQGQNAFVGNGLGGTSLLNANIFLRTDPKTQAMNIWPQELRDPAELEKYYQRAEFMLQPAPYPDDFPRLPKLDVLEEQAKALKKEPGFDDESCKFYRPTQTTRFVDGPNNVGVKMHASTLSGMDSTGINDGSKSTTLVTYLADAWNWGAEMFCQCEARYVREHPEGGYNVFFAWHGAKRGAFSENIHQDLMWVRAKKLVFFGAGAIGTTELLLRSKQDGLPLSSWIGRGMSGNGDILAFGYNTDRTVNSIGHSPASVKRPVGPTITGIIDCRKQDNPLDGFVIEEGAIPEALAALYQTMLELLPGSIPPEHMSFVQYFEKKLASVKSRLAGPYTPNGSVNKTQVYLIMSHDSNQAIMTLKDDKPVVQFLGVGRSEHVQKLNGYLAKITNAIGGTFVQSPFFASLGQQEITVHPIGGACLSSDGTPNKGASDHFGRLFKGTGNEYHEGLVVADGALVPTALGVNPFATITALAERSIEGVATAHGLGIDYKTSNGTLDLFGLPRVIQQDDDKILRAQSLFQKSQSSGSEGLEFTEVMSGFINIGPNVQDYKVATRIARGSCQHARFFLSVTSWDLDTLLNNKDHSALLTGTFTHGALPASPYMVQQGTFQLFTQDNRTPDTTNLVYDFDMIGTDGSKLHFHGYKIVSTSIAGSPLRTWRATSTLYVTVTDPRDNPDHPARNILAHPARGILTIAPSDLVAELKTFTPQAPSSWKKLSVIGKFLKYFSSSVASAYFGSFGALQWPSSNIQDHPSHPHPYRTYTITASDGVESVLYYWTPSSSARIQSPMPILFIPGAAVDHQIFALPTVVNNAIDYFTGQGFPCFAVTHRVGKSAAAQQKWTTYDARHDVLAALEQIRSLPPYHDQSVYCVAHCAGSLALSSGLLDGTIPASYIAGISASNVFFNPIFALVNKLKANLPIPLTKVYSLAAWSNWFDCSSTKNDRLIQRLLNQMLRLYPIGSRKEICTSVVCHRSELVFGRLWSHQNLNAATHQHLSHFLGGTSMTSLAHLVKAGTKGYALTNDYTNLVTKENLARLKGIRVFFFSGSENTVYSPESTTRSYETLRDMFGSDNYQRTEFAGKGHLDCWMSEAARDDIWAAVSEHATSIVTEQMLGPAAPPLQKREMNPGLTTALTLQKAICQHLDTVAPQSVPSETKKTATVTAHEISPAA